MLVQCKHIAILQRKKSSSRNGQLRQNCGFFAIARNTQYANACSQNHAISLNTKYAIACSPDVQPSFGAHIFKVSQRPVKKVIAAEERRN